MISSTNPPPASERNTSLPDDLLSSDTKVPLSNLIKEDVMEMIDPEDPQPLSDKESKSNNHTTIRPLTSPSTRKQRYLYYLIETIAAVLCLLFGIAILVSPCYFIQSPRSYTIYNEDRDFITMFAMAIIFWECIVICNIYTQFLYSGNLAVKLQTWLQIIFLGMATSYFFYFFRQSPPDWQYTKNIFLASGFFCFVLAIIQFYWVTFVIPATSQYTNSKIIT
jgi:hypothetical protein